MRKRYCPFPIFTMATMAGALALTSAARAGLCTLGHTHAGVSYEGGQFALELEADGAVIDGVETWGALEPEEVTILVPATTWQTVSAGAESLPWAFLGAAAGGDYFRLSNSTQDCSKEKSVYFGLGTDEIDYGTFLNDQVQFALTAVIAAPPGGYFSVYETGPVRWMDTADETPPKPHPFDNDAVTMPVSTHGHYSFAFSKPGTYRLELTASAQLSGGATVSDAAVFTFLATGPAAWNKLGQGGGWGNAANWDTWVPNSAYDWAALAKATGPATAVTLDGLRSLGRLTLARDAANADPNAGYKLQPGSGGSLKLDRSTKPALLEVSSGKHEIAAPLALSSDAEVDVSAGASLLLSEAITGSKKLTKTGGGTLTLSGSAGYTGGTEVQAGTLTIARLGALPLGRNVTIQAGGRLVLASGLSGAAVSAAVSDSLTAPAVVPEPGTLALLAAGFAVLVVAGGRPGRTP